MFLLFNPGLEIGQTIRNNELVSIFGCGNMGGMRRSHATNTLVIVSDYTKGLYHDKWIGGTLHYTGMGKIGDQDINWAQNATLAESNHNGVDVHLFEVIDPGEYIYCGRIKLEGQPYTEIQPDENGNDREVWMFPVRPVPDNDVRKPEMFVFADMDDYRRRGQNIDHEYQRLYGTKITRRTKAPVSSAPKARPATSSPKKGNGLVGSAVVHKTNGKGIVKSFDGKTIVIRFENGETKSFNYKICVDNQLIQMG